MNVLRQHGHVAWVTPTYKNGRALWRFSQAVCAPLVQAKLMDISKSERTITTHLGGFFGMYSADNIDAIRSEAFNLVVIDEAARVSEEARNDAIMPTLADAGGCEIDISTPKGMNWFYTEWQRGQDDGQQIKSWRAPSSANPNPQIQHAAELAKGRVPTRTYDQEWAALFVADGNYFQKVEECCVLIDPDRPEDHFGHPINIGLDWGKVVDFTSGTVGCTKCDRVVDWMHLNTFDYIFQRKAVEQLSDKWTWTKCKVCDFQTAGKVDKCPRNSGHELEMFQPRILPERNSIGGPNIELLLAADLRIEMGPDQERGFNMGATTKPALIDNLALALQRGKKFPKVYREEFIAYEVKTNANGHPTFSAPDGAHDDRVISAALENYLAINGLQLWI